MVTQCILVLGICISLDCPLLQTPSGHPDVELIQQTVEVVEEIIAEVDKKTGAAKCEQTRSKLEYLDEKQRHHLIDESEAILCDGVLKNNRGTVCILNVTDLLSL